MAENHVLLVLAGSMFLLNLAGKGEKNHLAQFGGGCGGQHVGWPITPSRLIPNPISTIPILAGSLIIRRLLVSKAFHTFTAVLFGRRLPVNILAWRLYANILSGSFSMRISFRMNFVLSRCRWYVRRFSSLALGVARYRCIAKRSLSLLRGSALYRCLFRRSISLPFGVALQR